MPRSFALALLIAVLGCAPRDAAPAAAELSPADVAGAYGQAGNVGSLDLAGDGSFSYTCFVMNGVTVDGCATFAGAGVSQGTWELVDGLVTFTPTSEPPDLVVKLAEASARPAGDGLVLTLGDAKLYLPREGAAETWPDLGASADAAPDPAPDDH